MKKTICLLLALILVLSVPTTVFAEENGPAASGTCGESATWTYADGTLTISGTYRGRRLVPNQPAYASKSILAKRLLNVNNRLRRTCRRLCFLILPFADGNDATPPPQPTGAEQRKAPPLPPPEWHEWCQTVSAAPPDAWGRCRGYHPARNA